MRPPLLNPGIRCSVTHSPLLFFVNSCPTISEDQAFAMAVFRKMGIDPDRVGPGFCIEPEDVVGLCRILLDSASTEQELQFCASVMQHYK